MMLLSSATARKPFGLQRPALRVLPAGVGLHGDDLLRLDGDVRLVVDLQLFARDGPAEEFLRLQSRKHPSVHALLEDPVARPTLTVLRPAQDEVRIAQKLDGGRTRSPWRRRPRRCSAPRKPPAPRCRRASRGHRSSCRPRARRPSGSARPPAAPRTRSPPKRATVSWDRTQPFVLVAASASGVSPASGPIESLTSLKLSRSVRSRASGSALRVRRASACCSRSRKSARGWAGR